LSVPIDGRGIDETAAAGDQRLQNGRRFLPGSVVVVVEDIGRTESDGWQKFTASRNRAHEWRCGLRGRRNGDHRRTCRDDKFAARQPDGHARSPVIGPVSPAALKSTPPTVSSVRLASLVVPLWVSAS